MSKANDIHKRDFYTTVADRFDTLANPFNQARRLEVIFDRLLSCDLQNQLVLDAGCGTGQIALQAQHRGARVIGIDISVAQLRQAKHKGLNNVTASDALHLPYPDALFDVVLSSEMIEHTIAPELAISEMARVLKPGGTLVLTCLNRAWKWLISLATSLKLRPFEGYENFPTFARLESFTQRSGLHIEQHIGFHPWPFQLKSLWRISRQVDRRWGASLWGRWMINQAILASKKSAKSR